MLMVERCLSRTEGMRKLIVDLLDLTRIESGRKKRELDEVDVTVVARAAVETAKPAADARGIAIELHAADALTMTADAGELEIILNNLVSNAVKYNRDRGRVDVTVEDAGEEVRIPVADTADGMGEEDVAGLFGEFVRIRNDRTKNVTGSGLGLSIVRRLASLYGGRTTVTSQPGIGSTFVVSLRRNAGRDDVA